MNWLKKLFSKLSTLLLVVAVVVCIYWVRSTYPSDLEFTFSNLIEWLTKPDNWKDLEPYGALTMAIAAVLAKFSEGKAEASSHAQSTTGDGSHNFQNSGSGSFSVTQHGESTHTTEIHGSQINQEGKMVSRDDYTANTMVINQADKTNKLPQELSTNIPTLHDLSNIIGREADLVALHKLLNQNQQVVLVNGLGGIGKTALAQAYVTKYKQDYAHIVWLHCDEQSTFVQDLVNNPGLMSNLGLSHSADIETDFHAIIRHLRALEQQPNLMVIDDARQDLQQWRDSLPKHPQWHVLLTSRLSLNGFKLKPLDFLTAADAFKLFKHYCPNSELNAADIRELIAVVDHHTLSVELLAKAAARRPLNFSQLKHAIANPASG